MELPKLYHDFVGYLRDHTLDYAARGYWLYRDNLEEGSDPLKLVLYAWRQGPDGKPRKTYMFDEYKMRTYMREITSQMKRPFVHVRIGGRHVYNQTTGLYEASTDRWLRAKIPNRKYFRDVFVPKWTLFRGEDPIYNPRHSAHYYNLGKFGSVTIRPKIIEIHLYDDAGETALIDMVLKELDTNPTIRKHLKVG